MNKNNVKDNILNLIDLYYLLNKKLIKYIYYNSELNQKLFICKEHLFNLIKISKKINEEISNNSKKYFLHVNINYTINKNFIEKTLSLQILALTFFYPRCNIISLNVKRERDHYEINRNCAQG